MNTRLLTLREVADYLQVHPGTVYRLVKRGQLCGLRVGRDLRFQIGKLEEFIARGGTVLSGSRFERSLAIAASECTGEDLDSVSVRVTMVGRHR
jgi:excisionase family DNA binding protein